MSREKKNNKTTGSTFAKGVAYLLFVISFVIAMFAMLGTYLCEGWNAYEVTSKSYTIHTMAYEAMSGYAHRDINAFYRDYIENGDRDALEKMCQNSNIMLEIYERNADEILVSNYNGEESPYRYEEIFVEEREVENAAISKASKEKIYECRLYVNDNFPKEDKYRDAFSDVILICDFRYILPVAVVISTIIGSSCFLFLLCAAGHKNGREGIVPGMLTQLPFDLLTAIWGVAVMLSFLWLVMLMREVDGIFEGMLMLFSSALLAVLCPIYCMDAAIRLKMGKWWENTILYRLIRMAGRALRFLGGILVRLPLVKKTVLVFFGIAFLEFCGMCMVHYVSDLLVLWILEKVLLFLGVTYLAIVCKRLQEGSRALAEGNLQYKTDTTKMLPEFQEHGENLNRIGDGMARAVEERMRSEHLKTELITNVSHDLKTPLTSIINYADLLGKEVLSEEESVPPVPYSQEKVAEYTEVLLRQSKRLKKLLEDLVEASKATTGNLEVHLQECEISVILSQALGEYEQKLAEKQLECIVRQPEESVWIMADGRHLWRVFDNLLNNICKYAQENTRVYLTVEKKQEVNIIFRNMSKYALDISAQELEERFVRGDKSRHMEGNGLGLSIAKSLVELQNGQMDIVIDGDLFKVVLRFAPVSKAPALKEKNT